MTLSVIISPTVGYLFLCAFRCVAVLSNFNIWVSAYIWNSVSGPFLMVKLWNSHWLKDKLSQNIHPCFHICSPYIIFNYFFLRKIEYFGITPLTWILVEIRHHWCISDLHIMLCDPFDSIMFRFEMLFIHPWLLSGWKFSWMLLKNSRCLDLEHYTLLISWRNGSSMGTKHSMLRSKCHNVDCGCWLIHNTNQLIDPWNIVTPTWGCGINVC